ncbi:MAG: CDC48 family AAA ATPase [Candidatus Micrarchaeota archaeon]
MEESVELRVAEALQNDVGRGLIRIDSRARKMIDVTTGDIVELKGKKNTAAVVWQAHPQDDGLNIIRMDGYLRNNAGVALGDKIILRKAHLKEAKKVVLTPSQQMKYSPNFDQYIKKKLIGRALSRGDTIFVGVLGTSFPLTAAVVQPQGIAIINEATEFVLKTEPMKETSKIARISYEDIGGIKDEVQKIREMVELPMRHPELFEKLGIEAPKGVLIHGPPGCGKTLLARAVASESDANFINIAGPELVSKFVGESEERLRQLFVDAEENAPSIIFMDEIDAIAPKREEVTGEVERRMVSQLLTLLDGLKTRGQVIVIGATNRPNALDPALRRPGRFDRELEIGVPDKNARKEILQIHTRSMPLFDWNSAVAAKEIGAVIKNITEEKIDSRKSEFEKEIKTLFKRKEEAEKELGPLKREEEKLSKEIEGADKKFDSNTSNIIIQNLKEKLGALITGRSQKEESLKSIIEEKKKITEELERIKKYNQTVRKNIANLKKISKELPDLENRLSIEYNKFEDLIRTRDLRKDSDPRQFFYEIEEKNLREKLSESTDVILQQLILLGVIPPVKMNSIKETIVEKSVERLKEELANITYGFTGADLTLLTKEAAMKSLRRILPEIDLDQNYIPPKVLESLRVTRDDFFKALREIQPSALREVFVEVPNVRWSDIGGLDELKNELTEAVELPLKKPEVFTKMGIRPVRGILLVGLPGTGKTLCAKAVATESDANFISIKGPEILSKWVGESEKAIREIFRKARMAAPSIVFIDEIDAIASIRSSGDQGSRVGERVVNALLTEMDGLQNLKNVVVIAATNRPDIIDKALMRPGRFDKILHISTADEKTRAAIFKVHTKDMPLGEVDLADFAKRTEGYTGADIEGLCREAGMNAIRAESDKVLPEHFENAFKTLKPAANKSNRESLKKFSENTGTMFR